MIPDVSLTVKFAVPAELAPGDSPTIVIYTNIKKEALPEVIETWLLAQCYAPVSESNALTERSEYTIRIGLRLEDDSFETRSDTGDDNLTLGIMLDVFQRLDIATVKDLDELPKELN